VSWDHGMGEELRRTPKNCDKLHFPVQGQRHLWDSSSICQYHSIFIHLYPSLSIFIHLLDFHELNEASNGSAEGQRLKELSPVVPLEFEICAVTKCPPLQDLPVGLHPRARRLVHPVFACVCTRFCSLFFPSLEVCGLVL